MFSDIYHIGYLTDDVARDIAFYQEVFGGELIAQAPGPDGVTKMAFLKVGNTEVELIEPGDKSRLGGRTGLILDHVGYLVPDIDAAVEQLRAKGIKFATEAPYTNALGHRLIYLDSATIQGTKMHLTQR